MVQYRAVLNCLFEQCCVVGVVGAAQDDLMAVTVVEAGLKLFTDLFFCSIRLCTSIGKIEK